MIMGMMAFKVYEGPNDLKRLILGARTQEKKLETVRKGIKKKVSSHYK